MEADVMKTKNKELIETWRKLQTSDHFYYMCTKWSNDGDVHAYFSPYQSPYDAYIAFMNALSDLQLRVRHAVAEREAKEAAKLAASEVVPKEEVTEHVAPEVVRHVPVVDVSRQIVSLRLWWQKAVDQIRSLVALVRRK